MSHTENNCPVCDLAITDNQLKICPRCGFNKINRLFLGMNEAEAQIYRAHIEQLREQWQQQHNWPSAGQPFQDELPGGIQPPLMQVLPAGVLRLGDLSGNGLANEKPVQTLQIEEFAVSVYPLTRQQYGGYRTSIGKPLAHIALKRTAHQLPMTEINWFEAAEYCAWLSENTKHHYRLLTEAEWEYAVRAGSESEYCFGNQVNELKHYAWYAENARNPQNVGLKQANNWGLHDMHGNVWEWTCSRYTTDYTTLQADQCVQSRDPVSIVVRGGDCQSQSRELRCAYRDAWNPVYRAKTFGFRVARVLESA